MIEWHTSRGLAVQCAFEIVTEGVKRCKFNRTSLCNLHHWEKGPGGQEIGMMFKHFITDL